MLLLVVALARAGEPSAYYHPDEVAKASQRFGAVAKAVQPAFEARQSELARAGQALQDLELGVRLLGDTAPEPLRVWAKDTRKQVTLQAARLQKHADGVAERTSEAFGAALERALPAVTKGEPVRVCGATGVAALMGKSNCKGQSLDPTLGRALDADPVLGKAIDGLVGSAWPGVEVPRAAQAPVALAGAAASDGWFDGAAVATRLVGARLDAARQEATDRADAAIESGDTAAARQATEAWHARLAADGATLRDELAKALARAGKKDAALGGVAWCGNPRALGGCTGTDRTDAVLDALAADTKLAKALGKSLPAPP
jgi:hypothetical protein